MAKTWYPGPGVSAAEANRAQLHPMAGEIKPGLNVVEDEDLARRMIVAGLVREATPQEIAAAEAPPAPAPAPISAAALAAKGAAASASSKTTTAAKVQE